MEKHYLRELNEGDEFYIVRNYTYGWEDLGLVYVRCKLKRVTPKRTKFVTEAGRELKGDTEIYLTATQEMLEQNSRVNYLRACYNYRDSIKKINFKELSDDDLHRAYKLLDELVGVAR